MFLAGNKAIRLSSVNYTIKTIRHQGCSRGFQFARAFRIGKIYVSKSISLTKSRNSKPRGKFTYIANNEMADFHGETKTRSNVYRELFDNNKQTSDSTSFERVSTTLSRVRTF